MVNRALTTMRAACPHDAQTPDPHHRPRHRFSARRRCDPLADVSSDRRAVHRRRRVDGRPQSHDGALCASVLRSGPGGSSATVVLSVRGARCGVRHRLSVLLHWQASSVFIMNNGINEQHRCANNICYGTSILFIGLLIGAIFDQFIHHGWIGEGGGVT